MRWKGGASTSGPEGGCTLVEGGVAGTLGEQLDHPADLPPAAEMNDIAPLAAERGARFRLAGGMIAESRDQFRRVDGCRPVGKMDMRLQGWFRLSVRIPR